MIFLSNHTEIFEEEDEGNIDDALLGELEDDTLDDEELLEGEIDPLLVPDAGLEEEVGDEEIDPLKEDEVKIFEAEEDDEDMEYDSFDDRDEM